MKKILVMLLISVLCISMAACGASGKESSSTPDVPSSSMAAPSEIESDVLFPEPPAGGDGITTPEKLTEVWYYFVLDRADDAVFTYQDVEDFIGVGGNCYDYDLETGVASYTWYARNSEDKEITVTMHLQAQDDGIYYVEPGRIYCSGPLEL